MKFTKVIVLTSAMFLALSTIGCTKALILPEGAKDDKSTVVIKQHRPKPPVNGSTTFAIVTAINDKKIDTTKYDEIHLQPGNYTIEAKCGSSRLYGGAGKFKYGNTLRDDALRSKGQVARYGSEKTSTYQIDARPGSRHRLFKYDSYLPHISAPENGKLCIFITD